MAESSDSTNITDLPNNNKQNRVSLETTEKGDKSQISREQIAEIVQEIQHASSKDMTQLPSRDIPQDTRSFVQDEQMRPNYVPQSQQKDYINDHNTEQYLLRQQQQQKETDTMDAFYNELQVPIFVMILFFFFQMPFVSKNMRKYLPSLYNTEANPNFWGYIFQTLLFGILFYGLQKFTKYLSQIDNLLRSKN